MAELEEEARQKAEEQGSKPPAGRRGKKDAPAKPKAKSQRNFTAPDSRIMLSADKSYIQGYNAQLAVDVQSHIVVASDLTDQARDVAR